MRPLLLLLTLLMLTIAIAPPANAQDLPQPAAEAAPTAAATPAAPEGPVEVPAPSELALQRYRSGNIIWAINMALGFLIPIVLLTTGWSARLQAFATRVGRYWYFALCIYFVVLVLALTLLELPWAYYTDFAREHAYGLSNQTHAKWIADTLIATALQLVVGLLVIWVPYLLLKKSPERWWLYTGLLAIPFIFFVILVTPIWVAPLFNTFGPMQNKNLETRILALADRAGIEGSRVYEVKKSEDTKTVNAYVTGFMNTKRIVLWDTILQKLDEEELLYVMGHEMGHYMLGHVVKTVFVISATLMLALYLSHRASKWLLHRYGGRWGFHSLAEIASLPLLMLLLQCFSFFGDPLLLAYSRHNEHEADRFGLELTRSNHAAATAFVKLQTENLGVPDPGWIFMAWRGSHPSIGQRIRFMNAYKPWETGEKPAYEHLFQAGGK
ncbi:MAG: M48 family metallopeptidase [Candidatus Hydrogenedentes bacterium]|nr:M48 family metallopeptidase [Candidatus Hydrogenedentota bacterium]